MSSHLDEAALAALRAALESERAILRREIEDAGGDPDSGQVGVDLERGFADSAHATAERANLIAVLDGLRGNLREVEHALARMEAGRYGTCERRGEPIPLERLEALPAARLCISCKSRTP
ncbi:MAG: TraR/DksA C4-type zinc finger protein [Actinobacteria bacterium]|nr:TraR/DksA C4-type zinc finger protein [Actinomycetota bacterium]